MNISSKINNINFVRPAGLAFFINFVALLPCLSEPNLGIFPVFFLISISCIIIISFFIIAGKPELLVDDQFITCRTKFPPRQKTYLLTDIIDFQWSGKPFIANGRHGPGVSLDNDFFELSFANDESISITSDQFANFSEIRNFFYNYCIEHRIINMRSLEERKRSRF